MEEFILNRASHPAESAESATSGEVEITPSRAPNPANPPVASEPICPEPFPNMPFFRIRPPNPADTGQPLFLTWLLQGSLPPEGVPPSGIHSIRDAFATVDRFLDEARTGPLYLRQREVASMVVETILAYGTQLRHYDLHSFVVMPNHVHLLLTPLVDLAKLTSMVRHATTRRANELLDQPGTQFWDEACCEHVVRSRHELERIQQYIERNPVPVGMAREAADYPYSSAARRTRAQTA